MTLSDMDDRLATLQNWLADLARWRAPLCDQLLALPPRIRDAKTLGIKRALELSIWTIDKGTGVLVDTGWGLTNLPLTPLMVADGYEPVGADLSRNYSGEMPWLGGSREVERELKDLKKRRDKLAQQQADATLSDAERAEREKENEAYRRVTRAMRITGSEDGSYLVARAPDGRTLEPSELTPEQRAALERANREHISR